MTAKQISGLQAPDGSTYITLTDGNGNLVGSSGTGTVTLVTLTTSNGITGSVATPSTVPAITVSINGSTSWTPVDASGAGLTFTSVNAQYTQIGNIVTAYGTLTYPSTTSATNAAMTLPVAVPNQTYAAVFAAAATPVGSGRGLLAVKNTTTAIFSPQSGGSVSNSSLSAGIISFFISYPAT
jgi:hypothetical protein